MNMPDLPEWATTEKEKLKDLVDMLDKVAKFYDPELNAIDVMLFWATIPESPFSTS
tara:strand:+ start:44 stop:211 length:168 start_codon:yes stop_codon:yes gene_type:complete